MDDTRDLPSIRARLADLERVARRLDPDPTSRQAFRQPVLDYAEEFLRSLPGLLVYRESDDQGSAILDCPIPEEGRDIGDLMGLFHEAVTGPGINPASARHLGYIPGGGLYPSALADFLADVTNRYEGIFFASPGAVRIGNLLLRWMAELVGFPPSAAGDHTSGGSIANLVAIVAARDARGVRAADIPHTVVYMTPQAHHCVAKALRIAGLGDAVVRYVPMDDRFRMDPPALEDRIDEDRSAGLRPFLVVASAGTTDTGAVDPVDAIALVAASHDLWLHVDAAYGGFFLLCPEGRDAIRGLSLADSVVLDPHKGLFLPYGSGAVLVKDREALYRSHHYTAGYMQDAFHSREEPSPADYSPELSRPFRSLRLWLPLQLFGLAPFRAALREKIWLARYFYERIQEIPGIEVGPHPELSVVVFRFVPQQGDANRFNARLVRAIQSDGRIFLSSTMIAGVFFIRLAVLVYSTHRETIDLALEVIRQKVEELRGPT